VDASEGRGGTTREVRCDKMTRQQNNAREMLVPRRGNGDGGAHFFVSVYK
jgi:hypothetical protein